MLSTITSQVGTNSSKTSFVEAPKPKKKASPLFSDEAEPVRRGVQGSYTTLILRLKQVDANFVRRQRIGIRIVVTARMH